jgi:hypothetical protein
MLRVVCYNIPRGGGGTYIQQFVVFLQQAQPFFSKL